MKPAPPTPAESLTPIAARAAGGYLTTAAAYTLCTALGLNPGDPAVASVLTLIPNVVTNFIGAASQGEPPATDQNNHLRACVLAAIVDVFREDDSRGELRRRLALDEDLAFTELLDLWLTALEDRARASSEDRQLLDQLFQRGHKIAPIVFESREENPDAPSLAAALAPFYAHTLAPIADDHYRAQNATLPERLQSETVALLSRRFPRFFTEALDPAAIEWVGLDMSGAYAAGAAAHLPNAIPPASASRECNLPRVHCD